MHAHTCPSTGGPSRCHGSGAPQSLHHLLFPDKPQPVNDPPPRVLGPLPWAGPKGPAVPHKPCCDTPALVPHHTHREGIRLRQYNLANCMG